MLQLVNPRTLHAMEPLGLSMTVGGRKWQCSDVEYLFSDEQKILFKVDCLI